MRTFWKWTVIFRGNLYRNLTTGGKRFVRIIGMIFRIQWYMLRFLLRSIFFILGVDWIRVERRIQRRLGIYFT